MTTTPKAQKDKPHAPAPRLTPRPTAASAARAARNATNRNLLLPHAQRQSPTRTSNSPVAIKDYPSFVKAQEELRSTAVESLSNLYEFVLSLADSRNRHRLKLEEERTRSARETARLEKAHAKVKSPAVRNPPRCDSKSDIKINRNSDIEDRISVPTKQEHDSYIVDNVSVVQIIEEKSNDKTHYGSAADLEGLIETDNFDDKYGEEVNNESVDRVPEQIPRSRPHTPAMTSRPQTPKSLQSSRPQTPRIPSRPTTPVHPHHGTPASRPNTPQRLATPNRPTTPLNEKILAQNPNVSPPRSPIKENGDIKSVYALKQKQFLRLKKELDLKQQAVLEVFDCLRSLRERMCQEGMGGGEGLQSQDLVMFNVADWAADEVAQLCRDAAASTATDGAVELINTIVPFDECVLSDIGAKAVTVPARFADLCLQAFTERQELIDWVKNLIERNPDNNSESLEKIARYNAQGLELCDTLRELKSCAYNVVDSVTQMARQACRERSALAAVGETLVRELAHLRQELEARIATVNDLRQVRSDNETMRMLEEARRELEEERAARIATKDKLSTTESQLRQTRVRVTKMDRQLREAEASIASLSGTVKTLEDQSRQREVQLEARARKLKESLKTGEVASGHIAQQRDALQQEVAELKEQIETITAHQKRTLQDLTNQLKDVKTVLEEQTRMTQHEIEQKHALQVSLNESQNKIEQLKAKITELENSRPNPELPTEREMDLWAELQATKETLRMTEDEVTACKREKVRFLETMTKITESDNKVAMQQKLAAELLSKEEIVGKMQIQIRELTKNIKLNEQKVATYEQYVRNLQEHNRAVANCQEAPNGISYQDLQQEIMNLRMSLLEAVHRNEELTEMLMQKEQQLEQQDKTSRAQARVIKVREELINMLKNKETEQSRELSALQQDLEHRMNIVGEVNKQIAAKAEEIQELFATLENKQQQIHRLEKIVLALEEQQRRAQAQRTRHEEKIAALEHELAAGGNRRERKFLFF